MILLIFTLTPETMQTTQYRKPRIWEMRVDKYTKSLAKNQVCEIMSYARYSEQRFTQIYKAFVLGDNKVSLWEAQNMAAGTNRQKHLLLSFPTDACMNSSLEELMKIKVNYLFWDKECLDSKISKNRNVFKSHNRFRDSHLNAASRKSLEIQPSSMAKRRTLSNRQL